MGRGRAERAWTEAHEAAAARRGRAGARVQELHLVSGLVLPVWQEVKRVLAGQPRPTDRRLRVIRLETTGALRIRPRAPCRRHRPWAQGSRLGLCSARQKPLDLQSAELAPCGCPVTLFAFVAWTSEGRNAQQWSRMRLKRVLHVREIGEDPKRLVGMLIPERALPELRAELESRTAAHGMDAAGGMAEPKQELFLQQQTGGIPRFGFPLPTIGGQGGAAAQKGSLRDIMPSLR